MRGVATRWIGDVRHLAVGVGIGLAGYGLLVLLLTAAALSLLGGLGLPLLLRTTGTLRRLADVQRSRSAVVPGSAYPPDPPAGTGTGQRVRLLLVAPATWRDLLWVLSPVQIALGLVLADLVVTAVVGLSMPALLPLWGLVVETPRIDHLGVAAVDLGSSLHAAANGALIAVLVVLLPRLLVRVERWQARALLSPTATARLSDRLQHVARTRTDALDASAVELRRIERDLHDGAQARLVGLAMHLGMAEDLLDSDPDRARTLVVEARTQARTAATELRDLVRGIHPPVLADRGVPGALAALAIDSPVPVQLEVSLTRRLGPPVESAVYFSVVEVVTNAVKHAGATSIRLTVLDHGDRLTLRVSDDGRGGADPSLGTGLRGVGQRLDAFDGSLRVVSPSGGPTVVEMELSCGS